MFIHNEENYLKDIIDEKIFQLDDFEFLEYIVNQNSRSLNFKGVEIIQDLLGQRLLTIGGKVKSISNKECESADLLIADFKGTSDITLTTIGHADTVLFPTHSNYFRFEDKGARIYGPGVADNKSGQLIAIKGIEYFRKKVENPRLNIKFISSPNEEVGSPGFHSVFKEIGLESNFVLGFEPSMPDGSLIHSRNGNRWYRLEVQGRTAHSGRAHKGHMNAAHDLCSKINYLSQQVLEHDDITMNIGMIEGGHSYNTICEKVYAKIDTRFKSFSGLEKIQSLFEGDLSELKQACSLTGELSETYLQVEDHCPPLEFTENNKIFLEKYTEIVQKIENKKIQTVHCGGAADVNHFSHKNLISFDGLGPIAANMHRLDEYVYTYSLESRAKAFGEFLIKIDNSLGGSDE